MDEQRLDDIEADLRATAEDLAADAARVQDIEAQKATLDADDPRVAKLSAEGEDLTAKMAHKARVESALSEAASKSGKSST